MIPATALENQGSRMPAPVGRSPNTIACANQGRPTSAQFMGTGTEKVDVEPPPAWVGGQKVTPKAEPGLTSSSEAPAGGRPSNGPRSRVGPAVPAERKKRSQLPGPREDCGVMVADQSWPIRTLPADKVSRLLLLPLYGAEVPAVGGPQEILKALLLKEPAT